MNAPRIFAVWVLLCGQALAVPQAAGPGVPSAVTQLQAAPLSSAMAVLTLDTRRPNANDDSTRGYAIGDLWRGPKAQMWVNQRATAGAAVWTILSNAAMPLPCDAATTAPVACYGTRRMHYSYSGAPFRVQRSSDSTQLDIPQAADGLADTTVLWGFCANTICRVATLYDQSGSAYNATQSTFTLMPLVGPVLNYGNSPALLPDYAYTTAEATVSGWANPTGSPNGGYLVIPSGVSVSTHTVSVVAAHRNRLGRGTIGIVQQVYTLGSLTSGQAFQWATDADLQYEFYPGNGGWSAGRPQASPQVSVVVSSSTGLYTAKVDNQATESGYLGAAATLAGGLIGANTGAGVGSPVALSGGGEIEVAGLAIYNANLSSADQTNAQAAMYSAFGLVPQARSVVCFQGDSIIRGYIQPFGIGLAGRMADALPNSVRVVNRGEDGQTLQQMTSSFSGACGGTTIPANAPNAVFVLFASGNGIAGGSTAPQEEGYITTLVAAAKSAGYSKVVLVTGSSRNAFTSGSTADNTRLAVNSWINANAISLGYTVADVGADPLVGATGQGANTSYFVDGTHPTKLGGEIMAAIIDAAVMKVLQ